MFTKSLIFVFILVIGCSKPGIMIFSRKAAEAVSRSLSCDKADRKSSFLPLFFQTPFAKKSRCHKQRGALCMKKTDAQKAHRSGAVGQSISEPSLPSGNARFCGQFVTHCLQMQSGAGSGTRTHTMSPPTDFESVTSTIPSCRRVLLHYNTGKGK